MVTASLLNIKSNQELWFKKNCGLIRIVRNLNKALGMLQKNL